MPGYCTNLQPMFHEDPSKLLNNATTISTEYLEMCCRAGHAGFEDEARVVDDFIARYGESGEETIITTVEQFQGVKELSQL